MPYKAEFSDQCRIPLAEVYVLIEITLLSSVLISAVLACLLTKATFCLVQTRSDSSKGQLKNMNTLLRISYNKFFVDKSKIALQRDFQ